ncbi:MAG: hypothetical protein LBQ95_04210 [Lachnospiraceae bacterium]|jgi:protein-tyrosine phosphatase|nr:hypothetical protein [Lachnospiraceae bacterium]
MIIDFHAHVLPKADHGSNSIECSQKQIELANEAGVQCIVATPHFYPQKDNLAEFLSRRVAGENGIVMTTARYGMHLLIGCEVHACPGIEHMEGIEKLCIRGTQTLLLEMPVNKEWSQALIKSVRLLKEERNFKVVLAHIDRYDPEKIKNLLDMGLKAQLNAGAFVDFRKRKQAMKWVESGRVVAIGSDIHGTDIGYTQFTKALSILKERSDRIMRRSERLCKKCIRSY